MTAGFKPMLAGKAVVENLQFPLMASPKLDGVRAVVRDGVVLSRTLKPIPNAHVQQQFCGCEGFDGELIVGSPTDPAVYRNTTSGVMTAEGAPDVTFFVFDTVSTAPYLDRYKELGQRKFPGVIVLEQVVVHSLSELAAYEEQCLADGYEGVMVRSLYGRYKYGRSTAKEGTLLKVKRFEDAEAEVIGYDELLHNDNAAFFDERGYTKRTTHQEGKRSGGTLGSLLCRTADGIEFGIGTGFDNAARDSLWAGRDSLVGKLVKYKYFPSGGKTAPRFPVFLGFRDTIDV